MPHEEPPRRMRSARLAGLSPDGKSLIVVTESGEELIIEADERLRAAVRGDRPRPDSGDRDANLTHPP